MQLIIISPNKTKHQHWHFTQGWLYSLAIMTLILLMSLAYTVYQFTVTPTSPPTISLVQTLPTPPPELKQNDLASLHSQYVKQLGSLQAEAIRLKALANKLADMNGLDIDVEGLAEPGVGGIEGHGEAMDAAEFEQHIADLHSHFEQQQTELEQIQDYLIQEHNAKSAIPSGKPVKKGWISSYYGYRIDPFNGKKVFHNGLDIAGKAGSEVVAVADGIVIWQGSRGGYGEMIEIDHGNGYQTRYAHNKKLMVQLGDRIKKGQTVALMGSTGRSTGPHVHFEVLRDGKTINPVNFLKK